MHEFDEVRLAAAAMHWQTPGGPLDYPEEDSTARFSADRVYRYALWRIWNRKKPYVMFIGLNPSTADETKNDPTVTRCVGYAKRWGYGALCMMNAFAFRSTDPKKLPEVADPVGEANDAWIWSLARHADKVVACWGAHGAYRSRGNLILEILDCYDVYCFGKTKDGMPKHPLYLRADQELELLISWMDQRAGGERV
jgi:hypothetical protein